MLPGAHRPVVQPLRVQRLFALKPASPYEGTHQASSGGHPTFDLLDLLQERVSGLAPVPLTCLSLQSSTTEGPVRAQTAVARTALAGAHSRAPGSLEVSVRTHLTHTHHTHTHTHTYTHTSRTQTHTHTHVAHTSHTTHNHGCAGTHVQAGLPVQGAALGACRWWHHLTWCRHRQCMELHSLHERSHTHTAHTRRHACARTYTHVHTTTHKYVRARRERQQRWQRWPWGGRRWRQRRRGKGRRQQEGGEGGGQQRPQARHPHGPAARFDGPRAEAAVAG